MFGNIGDMMKQAKALQENMEKMQEEAMHIYAEGKAGGGMVSLTLNGKSHIQAIVFDDSLQGEPLEMIADLVIAAHHDAKHKLDHALEEKMQSMTSGLNLPMDFLNKR